MLIVAKSAMLTKSVAVCATSGRGEGGEEGGVSFNKRGEVRMGLLAYLGCVCGGALIELKKIVGGFALTHARTHVYTHARTHARTHAHTYHTWKTPDNTTNF